jgi:hypothetical protein
MAIAAAATTASTPLTSALRGFSATYLAKVARSRAAIRG